MEFSLWFRKVFEEISRGKLPVIPEMLHYHFKDTSRKFSTHYWQESFWKWTWSYVRFFRILIKTFHINLSGISLKFLSWDLLEILSGFCFGICLRILLEFYQKFKAGSFPMILQRIIPVIFHEFLVKIFQSSSRYSSR